MKKWFLKLLLSTMSVSLLASVNVVPEGPMNPEGFKQYKVEFSEQMEVVENPFTVDCDPAISGKGHWVAGNKIWAFDLDLAETFGWRATMPAGSTCKIQANSDLKTASGEIVVKAGFTSQFTAEGFKFVGAVPFHPEGSTGIHEKEPILALVFNSPVVASEALSANNPQVYALGEDKRKIQLVPVKDSEQVKENFNSIYDRKKRELSEAFRANFPKSIAAEKEAKESHVVYVTLDKTLKPGEKITVMAGNVSTTYRSQVKAVSGSSEIKVRKDFQASYKCEGYQGTKGKCRPEFKPSVVFNAPVTWGMAGKVVLEYIPVGKEQPIQVGPEKNSAVEEWIDSFINDPQSRPIAEIMVSEIEFDVFVKPNTKVKVIYPDDFVDGEKRMAMKQTQNYYEYGSFAEVIRFPSKITYVPLADVSSGQAFPMEFVNLHQSLILRYSSEDAKSSIWSPVKDVEQVLSVVQSIERSNEIEWSVNGANSTEAVDEALVMYLANTPQVQLSQSKSKFSGELNSNYLVQTPFNKGNESKLGVYYISAQSKVTAGDDFKAPQFDNDNLGTQVKSAMVVVTDLNLHMKKGKDESTVWLTSYETGAPVAGVQLNVYTCDFQVAVNGETDSNGLFTFKNPKMAKGVSCANGFGRSFERYFVVAKKDSDLTVADSSYSTITRRMGWAAYSDSETVVHATVGVNLVKPGQKTHVEFVAKKLTQNGFGLVDASTLPSEAKVYLYSRSGEEVEFIFPIEWVNNKASFTWNVPASAQLGTYDVSLVSDTYHVSKSIEVSDFKVPVMSAELDFKGSQILTDKNVVAFGQVQFANGNGAKNQPVQISYEVGPNFSGLGLDYENPFYRYGFFNGEYKLASDDKPVEISHGKLSGKNNDLMTDQNGEVSFDIVPEMEKVQSEWSKLVDSQRSISIASTLRFQDIRGQWQSKEKTQVVYGASSYLGATSTYSENKVVAKAVILDVKTKEPVRANDIIPQLFKIKKTFVSERLFGGIFVENYKKELVNYSVDGFCSVVSNQLECDFTALDQGSYVFQTTDKKTGQKAYDLFDAIEVDGMRSVFNDDDNLGSYMKLTADKVLYKDGEKAKVSFESPYSQCWAMVTLERANVLYKEVVSDACAKGFVELPVKGTLAPNVVASVYLVEGESTPAGDAGPSVSQAQSSFKVGQIELKIKPEAFLVDVDLKMDKESYKPGDVAQVTVQAKAQTGTISDAEVTLVAIEKKILELRPNDTYDIVQSFMVERSHLVSFNSTSGLTGFSETFGTDLVQLRESFGGMHLESAERSGARKAARPRSAAPAPRPAPVSAGNEPSQPRKLFDALVAWKVSQKMVNGQAKVEIKLNDSLTEFAVFAIVTTDDQKFGTGETSYLASQDVQTESTVPDVVRKGDKFPVSLTLTNHTNQNRPVTVEVQATARNSKGEIVGEMFKSTAAGILRPSESVTRRMDAMEITDEMATVQYVMTVKDENGVVIDEVHPAVQKVVESVPMSVQDSFVTQMVSDKEVFSFEKSKLAVPGKGWVQAQVSSGLVDSTKSQIMKSFQEDSFYSLLVANRLIKALVFSSADNTKELSTFFNDWKSLVDKKGMIKFFPGAKKGNFWLTTELVRLIGAKPWALAVVPEPLKIMWQASFGKVMSAQTIEQADIEGASEDSFLLARLRSYHALSAMNFLVSDSAFSDATMPGMKNPSEMNLAEQVEMALYVAKVNPEGFNNAKVVQDLKTRIEYRDNSAVLVGKLMRGFFYFGYTDEVIATSKFIKALSLVKDKKTSDNLVQGLILANKSKKWYTHYTKAWILNGFESFSQSSAPVSGETILTSSEGVFSSIVNWNQKTSGGFVQEWKADSTEVVVEHNGEGKPWVSVTTQSAREVVSNEYEGIEVTKVISNQTREDGSFRVGDRVRVELTVYNHKTDLAHVALFDPIPAGANILSEAWGWLSFGQKSYEGYKFYFYSLPTGESKLAYEYQLNNTGDFKMPPTHVKALYEPSVYGKAPNKMMRVKVSK